MLSTVPQPGMVASILTMFPRYSAAFTLSENLELGLPGMACRIFSPKHPIDGQFHDDAARERTLVTYLPQCGLAGSLRRSPEVRPRAPAMVTARRQLVEAQVDLRRDVAQLRALPEEASRLP